MYTLSVVLLGLFIVPWFLLLDTGTGWGIMLDMAGAEPALKL